jgi:tetrahydromethanopterin S-methyltransferase subunit G
VPLQHTLVDEDEARRIHERLDDAAEEPALDRHVSAGLLVGDQAFF